MSTIVNEHDEHIKFIEQMDEPVDHTYLIVHEMIN